MSNKIKISIIVPVFNVEKYVERCIESLVNQDYDNIEIILIDDGSEDNSLKICKDYEKKYKNIKVYSKNNTGVSDTRNLGIEKAIGDYITFVDSDDFIAKDYISNVVNVIKYNQFRLIRTGYTLIRDEKEKKLSFIEEDTKEQNLEDVIKGILTTNLLNSSCMFFIEKNFLNENKIRFKNDIQYGEDLLFSIECYANVEKALYINNTGYYYYYNSDNSSSTTNIDKRIKYCIDNINVYSKLYFYGVEKEYITFNIYNKINYAMKFILSYNSVNYKEMRKILEIIMKNNNFNVINKYSIMGIKYNQPKINKLLTLLLYKKYYIGYYIILKIYKFIKWR